MPRSRKDDEFAALLSRATSPEVDALIDNVYHEVTAWEREKGVRSNERRAVTGARFREALERLLGDLLRARAEPSSTGRIYRAVRPNDFSEDVVSYRQILLQKSLMVPKNGDSVAVMRFAVEASDDGAA